MKSFFTLCFMLCSFILPAQYSVTPYTDAGNPGGLVTESVTTTTGWTVIAGPSQATNDWSAVQTLPFAFNFYGTAVTQFKVSHNFVLTFDVAATAVPGDNTTLPNAALPDKSIAAMWDAFTSSPPTATNDRVYTKTFGTAPNRQFWIKWFSFETANGTSYNYTSIVLEESTNKIYVVDEYDNATTATTTVGIQLNSTAGIHASGSPNIAGSGNGTSVSDNDYWEFTPACIDPPVAGTVTPSADPVCAGVDFTLFITGGTAGAGQTYQWQSSADNTTWTNISGATNATLTTSQSGSTWYRVVITCGTTVNSASVQVTTPAVLAGGTYTINSAGGGNYTSIGQAVNAMCGGIAGPVIFNVAPGSGPYNEQLVIPPVSGASATNTITFNGNGATISDNGTTTTSERAVIRLDGADYVTINDFVVNTGSGTYGWGVHLINDADNNTISNNTITTNSTSTSTVNFAGIVVNSSLSSITAAGDAKSDNNTITGNTVKGGYIGVAITADGATNTVTGNKILNNTIQDFYQSGIFIDGTINSVVQGNDISRPTRTNSSASFYGINLDNVSTGALINGNRIHDPFQSFPTSTAASYGIRLINADAPVGSENILSNNLIYNFFGSDDNQNGIIINNSDNVKMFYNTISLEDAAASCACAARGIYIDNTNVVGLEIRNNIIVLNRGGSGDKQALFFEPTSVASYTIDNNVYYLNASAPGTGIKELARVGGTSATGGLSTGGTSYATLAAWQGTGKDANAVSADPMFTSSTSFIPTNSAVDNTGSPVTGVTTDITGAARSATTPDAGAYEWTAPMPVALLEFSGSVSGTANSLYWRTATETNNRGFHLERSADGKQFSSIAFIASRAAGGNSTTLLDYRYTDAMPLAGTGYYRLRQVDMDGKQSLSNVVEISRNAAGISITSVYPNPASQTIHIAASSNQADKASLLISDISGKIIRQVPVVLKPGVNRWSIDVASLATGIYQLRLECGQGCPIVSHQFMKQ